ncbi:MAG TPA: type II toxin-antitoxin system RelE/ParE family toxin [Xanthomonadaceae bacterium]
MTSSTVLWTQTALSDLTAIIDHIAAENPNAALDVLQRLQARAEALADLAPRGRVVPELRDIGVNQYRELIERPWRLVYRTDGARTVMIAVLDARRDLDSLLLERLTRL